MTPVVATPSPTELTRFGVGLLTAVRATVLVGLLVLCWWGATAPDVRPYDDLQQALSRGAVDSVHVQAAVATTPGGVEVSWSTGPLRSHLSAWTVAPGDPTVVELVDAAARRPDLTLTAGPLRVRPRGPQAALPVRTGWDAGLAALCVLGALLLLRRCPPPVLATRWAWFWVCVVLPVAWPVFVLLEPAPLWRPERPLTVRRRLTARPAFLAGFVVLLVRQYVT